MKNPEKPASADKKRKIRNDLILIGGLIIVLVIAGLMFRMLRGDGDSVVVEVDGKLYGTYSLAVDRTVEIRTGEDGADVNVLVIKDGKAYVESANCRDGICAAHKPVSKQGESIVCLPHKVVITVKTTQSGVTPDIAA
ncbi:MAG: NusG domain II-containing protein [Clostridia bacterium]|nr:NusG domain II-containing protein [Clostridia bacterium]